MSGLIIDSEPIIRLSIFLAAFFTIALAERLAPRRVYRLAWQSRWLNNLAMSVLNTLFVRVLVPLSATALAVVVYQNGWGLLNVVDLPLWVAVLLFVMVFDLTIYFQHRLFHYVPWLWRLHRVHHTDLDYDITTGNRFHPVSILISMLIKLCLVFVIGGSPLAVIIAEVLLNLTSMFNHSNINIPVRLDRILRFLVVTPDMHRVHHSIKPTEHNNNFGFSFPWWDRLFGTYQAQPVLGHHGMQIGIAGFDEHRSVGVGKLLVQPLYNPANKFPGGR